MEIILPPEWPISAVDNSVAERWKKVLLSHCSSDRANPTNFPHTKQRRILSGRGLPRKTSISKSLGDPKHHIQGHHWAYRQHAYPFQQDEKYVAYSFIPPSRSLVDALHSAALRSPSPSLGRHHTYYLHQWLTYPCRAVRSYLFDFITLPTLLRYRCLGSSNV